MFMCLFLDVTSAFDTELSPFFSANSRFVRLSEIANCPHKTIFFSLRRLKTIGVTSLLHFKVDNIYPLHCIIESLL